jgi:manganese transport protein
MVTRTRPRPSAKDALPGEARVLEAAQASLAGERHGLRAIWPFLGPAFIAAVAYVDPGNFATNMAGGAKYGYLLLWVILAANIMAMIIQSMSAKLGIATGRNLPEVCREQFSRRTSIGLWLQAEVIAMATDLAEFIGAALGFHLLFGTPLFLAGLVTGVIAFAILALQARGFRPLEAVITGLVGVIVIGFAFQVFLAQPDPSGVAHGLLTPQFADSESVLLAAGILGATVMPHVIYLHSALTQRRVVGADDDEKQRIYRFERIDVIIAMGIAGIVNMSMLMIAAAVFHSRGLTDLGDLEEVYVGLGTYLGDHSDTAFGIALLASGLSSSSVGTLAGQVVMQGFIRRQIPLYLRRGLTMAPALILLAIGVNASSALVLSQVVLSFGIPFALIPLLLFCRNRELMGVLVNRRITTLAAIVAASVIIALNVFLLGETFFG